jgi:hypothetical protein
MKIQRQNGIVSTINFTPFLETSEYLNLRNRLFERAAAESNFAPTNRIDAFDESILVFDDLAEGLGFLAQVLRGRECLQRSAKHQVNLRSSLCQGAYFVHQDQIYGDAINLATRLAGTSRENELLICCVDTQQVKDFVDSQQDIACFIRNQAENCLSIGLLDSDSTNFDATNPVLRLEYHDEPRFFETSRNRKINIGRAPDADIIIDHDHISRDHATITLKNDHAFIEDHSSNGTYLYFDGREIFLSNESVSLKSSGFISCGLKKSRDPKASANLLTYVVQQSGHGGDLASNTISRLKQQRA